MRCAFAKRPADQCQCQCLGFERFRSATQEAVAQHRHQCLGARIHPPALAPECHVSAVAKLGFRRKLGQDGGLDGNRQAGIAALDGMADAVALAGIEEQNLIGLGHGIVTPEMAHIDAAIGIDQLCRRRAFLRPAMPAPAAAHHVADRDDVGGKQALAGKLRHDAGLPRAWNCREDRPRHCQKVAV
jgi:hypothetical protein